VGFFDGVHPGHRFLLQEMQRIAAERDIPSAVITFPVHPRVVLLSDYQPKLLNSFDEKLQLLSETGVDYAIVIDFTPELARMTAREFMSSVLVPDWRVRTLLIGYNHRFGFQRAGGTERYILDGEACGVEVIRISSYSGAVGTSADPIANADGTSAHPVSVSSSMVRRLIEAGDVAAASRLLGYHYQLKGNVIEGNRLGIRLGFPTANIELDDKYKVMPRDGSYAVRITIDNKRYNGMLYIGSRPTVGNDDSLRIEVNIFDFADDIYGKSIVVEFIEFIREGRKFNSLDELRKQIQDDKMKAMTFFSVIARNEAIQLPVRTLDCFAGSQ